MSKCFYLSTTVNLKCPEIQKKKMSRGTQCTAVSILKLTESKLLSVLLLVYYLVIFIDVSKNF